MRGHLSSELNEKVVVLTLLQDDETGDIAWAPARPRWASVELEPGRNLYSAVGMGAQGATIRMRPDARLRLHHALEWRGQFLHLTSSYLDREKGCLEVKAALCVVETMVARERMAMERDELNRPVVKEQKAFHFPGILAELWHRSEDDGANRSQTTRRALVTPKAVTLRAGDLVERSDKTVWSVVRVLDLEPHKNE